tara:strand:+ start:760 stop:948 length:189 start_codon:yes stop_codon:yes gene_type:complete
MANIVNKDWLGKALADYDNLDDSAKAHVDAACDAATIDHNECMCGKPIDDCPDSYDHMTHGY